MRLLAIVRTARGDFTAYYSQGSELDVFAHEGRFVGLWYRFGQAWPAKAAEVRRARRIARARRP